MIVNGCAGATMPNGMLPIRFANSRKTKAVNTHGRNFLPSGPMLTFTMSSTKAIRPSTATCQRPGISSRFIPPNMNSQIVPRTISVHSALLVKTNGIVVPERTRDRLDHELVHRVDFAVGSHSRSLFPFAPSLARGGLFEIRMTFQMPTAKPRNSITNISQGFVSEPPVQQPADDPAPERAADELTQDQLAGLITGIRLALGGPLRLRLLQPVEPLIERFEPRVWWKLRDLVDLVLSHVSPLCVAPAEIHGASQGRGTWRKARPPRRGPFMNGVAPSQPREAAGLLTAVIRPRRGLAGARRRQAPSFSI